MKKTYINPAMESIIVSQTLLQNPTSPLTFDSTQEFGENSNDFGVKEDVSSSHAYNVWNDDWSNN